MYPVRVGEHSNTAFGLIFALEYAECKFFTTIYPNTTCNLYNILQKLMINQLIVMMSFLNADVKDEELIELISGPNVTGKYFSQDRNCPIDWEPSGFDFLSPCLQVILDKNLA